MSDVTKTQVRAALNTVLALGDAIREIGVVPSGKLYAAFMSVLDLESYNRAIDLLVQSELVERRGDVLVWKEPAQAAA